MAQAVCLNAKCCRGVTLRRPIPSVGINIPVRQHPHLAKLSSGDWVIADHSKMHTAERTGPAIYLCKCDTLPSAQKRREHGLSAVTLSKGAITSIKLFTGKLPISIGGGVMDHRDSFLLTLWEVLP